MINGYLIRTCLLLWTASLAVLAAGCASSPFASAPFEQSAATSAKTPQQVVLSAEPDSGTVIWGGLIMSSTNTSDKTEIEVLSYPLDRLQRPNQQLAASGRFLLRHDGYLETVDYAPGRFITVLGTLGETETGTIGESEYRYATVNADQLHLWSGNNRSGHSGVSFGIGISLSN